MLRDVYIVLNVCAGKDDDDRRTHDREDNISKGVGMTTYTYKGFTS